METISIPADFLGHTHRETISTRKSIAIISYLSLNALNCFIIATKAYLCLYISILWSDLDSSRMCLWNKIPIPPFGARSNVYDPCIMIFPYKDHAESCEIKNVSSLNVCKSIIAWYLHSRDMKTQHVICVFVFAYAESRFSHDAVHMKVDKNINI